jgi:hypothetical protein
MVVYYLRLGNKVVVKLLHSCFGMRYCAFPMSSISCCKIINLSLTVCAYILSLPLSLTVTLTEYHSVRNSLIFAFFMVRSFSPILYPNLICFVHCFFCVFFLSLTVFCFSYKYFPRSTNLTVATFSLKS